MQNYTTRITMQPVTDDNWDGLYSFIDTIPGAILVENPQTPTIVCDVDGDSWNKAQMFILGLASHIGLGVASIEKEGERESTTSEFLPGCEEVVEWVSASPQRQVACC